MISKWCTLAVTAVISLQSTGDSYLIGVGRADCTGPPVEIGFMGYAKLSQKGQGIHLRQYARTFIIVEDDKRIAFASVDIAMISSAVKRKVIDILESKYDNLYTESNVVISGTHTHAAPGGFLMYLLYDISILGYVSETFDSLSAGIANSIIRAHEDLQEGKVFIAETEVIGANINRSPSSYLNNPADERALFEHDVDKTLTQLRLVNNYTNIIGVFNWFAVHPTSMNNTNVLVSSDNLGYASMLLEKEYNPNQLPGKGKFVGAFCSSNLGDVSPNVMGPKCQFSNESCDILTSACPKQDGPCFASGPGKDMFESTKLIAEMLYNSSSKLLKLNSGTEVSGKVNSVHEFINMPKYNMTAVNDLTGKMEVLSGCIPAMGYSFAAGTTDGPGAFNFEQGTTSDNVLWNTVRDFIVPPSQEDIECQFPKPVLLATGRATFPVMWQPHIVPVQVLMVGALVFVALPGEFTTMSGRRLKTKLQNLVQELMGINGKIILAGLANEYTSYITTPEEYQAQRYEAASTIYGPNTLSLYINIYEKLIQELVSGVKTFEEISYPPYLDDNVLSFNTRVMYDGHPIGRGFGFVKLEPNLNYEIGSTVRASFVAANPRNNILHEKTFISVERLNSLGIWYVVHTDASWETRFYWTRVSTILGFSDIDVEWETDANTEPGVYRIRHFGHYKYILGGIFSYEGVTRSFGVS